ncbi:thiamine phosphate synthase [Niallia endozanthoxylica]|uniref:Thiamine-phosphate synthase n=1 Tax=Niallia endozanthoxylica TaxID=2036016 RepID=A0A5J5HVL2_9BACI|nr:thiamine phosphate synthase [Niallia endozanthoxylica]KAA9025713.1 thiamine phosphate synthase [Niallia endozanthoxylica]
MKITNHDRLRNALALYFIMGSLNTKRRPSEVLTEAIRGGVTCFQFREKGRGSLVGEEKYTLAEELQFICQKAEVPFIVNDDIDLALAINADGVHIGQEDEPVNLVREKIGSKILGVSVHNSTEANSGLRMGADYFGVGPIYPTQSKDDANQVQGVKIIQELRSKGFTIPIVGIGGITANNGGDVIKAGADGISVISAISLDANPEAAAANLKVSITNY